MACIINYLSKFSLIGSRISSISVLFLIISRLLLLGFLNDNAMIPIEVVHRMKVNKRSRDKIVVLKLDISKAYNRIDWLYP